MKKNLVLFASLVIFNSSLLGAEKKYTVQEVKSSLEKAANGLFLGKK